MHGVGQAHLFQRDGNLAAVRRGPGVEVDHGVASSLTLPPEGRRVANCGFKGVRQGPPLHHGSPKTAPPKNSGAGTLHNAASNGRQGRKVAAGEDLRCTSSFEPLSDWPLSALRSSRWRQQPPSPRPTSPAVPSSSWCRCRPATCSNSIPRIVGEKLSAALGPAGDRREPAGRRGNIGDRGGVQGRARRLHAAGLAAAGRSSINQHLYPELPSIRCRSCRFQR